MKKLVSIAAMAVLALANVQAQDSGFEQGDVFVTGSVQYNHVSQGDFSDDAFEITPSVGYFVTENIALEALVSYRTGSAIEEFGLDVDTNTFGGGLAATYFFTPSNQFSLTTALQLSYQNTEIGEGNNTVDASTFGAALSPGVHYFVSDSFALRASIGGLVYTNSSLDVDGAESQNNFGLNLNFSDIQLGLVYKF